MACGRQNQASLFLIYWSVMMFPVKVMNKCSYSRSTLQKTMSLACEEVILFQVGKGISP